MLQGMLNWRTMHAGEKGAGGGTPECSSIWRQRPACRPACRFARWCTQHVMCLRLRLQAAAASGDWLEAADCVVTSLREQRAQLG